MIIKQKGVVLFSINSKALLENTALQIMYVNNKKNLPKQLFYAQICTIHALTNFLVDEN